MFDFKEKVPRKDTNCVKFDHMDMVYESTDLLPFWIADMDIKTPQPIIDAMQKRLEHPVFGYSSWKTDCFYNAVQHWFKTRFDVRPLKQDIVYAPSVLFTITEVIRMLTRDGEGVIINTPSYNNFINLLEGNRRNIIEMPLEFDGAAYSMDMKAFEALCERADVKIFLMCNPHNPTGKVFTAEEITEIVDICRRHDIFIICDEIHMDFVRTEAGHQTLVKWMEPDSPILITTCLGKSFNISGLPHSYFITKHRYVLMELSRRIMSVYGLGSVNPVILEAIHAAYFECADWMDALNDYLAENMEIVKAYIDEHLNDSLEAYIPESTFLMWIDFKKSGFDEAAVQHAMQHIGKIAVGIGSTYELHDSTHFRFNVGCDRDTLNEGLARLKRTFDYLKSNNK